jgi:hypothetical protein
MKLENESSMWSIPDFLRVFRFLMDNFVSYNRSTGQGIKIPTEK